MDIRDNVHLRTLWPLSEAISMPLWLKGGTLTRRPLLSYSFALNYALGGTSPWSYHAVNLAIHLAAGLLLAGIIRRTLARRGGLSAAGVEWIAAAAAVLWVVHPLQTAAVTYIIQRAESLTGMLLFLTLYCSLRGMDSAGRSVWWYIAAVGACTAGMLTKESMAIVPLVVLLYDRTFVAGAFAAALRRRWGLYAGLFATWAVVAGLVLLTLSDAARDFGSNSLTYLMTQPEVILYYLRLTVWPAPLLADYAWANATVGWPMLSAWAALTALAGATVWALVKRHWLGFLGAWFFLTLAPSSSIVALLQNVQIQRMYLPLAAIGALAALGAWRVLGRRGRAGLIACSAAVALVAGALAWGTHRRNSDYHDYVGFWRQNVHLRPEGYMAQTNLGVALFEDIKKQKSPSKEAVAEFLAAFEAADRASGNSALAKYNLAKAQARAGQAAQAQQTYRQALALRPDFPEVHCDLAEMLFSQNDLDGAMAHYRQAADAHPLHAPAWQGIGAVLARRQKYPQALEALQRAYALTGRTPEVLYNIGTVLIRLDRSGEAVPYLRQAAERAPDQAQVHQSLGQALLNTGATAQARRHLERALDLRPIYPEARFRLGMALAAEGNFDGAIASIDLAIRQGSRYPQAYFELAKAHAAKGDFNNAVRAMNLAIPAARAVNDEILIQQLQNHLDAFKTGKAYHQPARQ